ncbi:transposase [Streptomyces chartreusis]|uniref:transposase n=1 Tax=Streptomyces chartreusis TaxID=1969 RepID=UPI0037231FBE
MTKCARKRAARWIRRLPSWTRSQCGQRRTSHASRPAGTAARGGGRKRHLVVDCLGLVLAVAVTAANVQDRDAAVPLLERLRRLYFSVQFVWADGG